MYPAHPEIFEMTNQLALTSFNSVTEQAKANYDEGLSCRLYVSHLSRVETDRSIYLHRFEYAIAQVRSSVYRKMHRPDRQLCTKWNLKKARTPARKLSDNTVYPQPAPIIIVGWA